MNNGNKFERLLKLLTSVCQLVIAGKRDIDRVIAALQEIINVPDPPLFWREQGGIIYFSVTSDGTTGEEWIRRLEGKGFRVGDYARQLLMSDDFKPTLGMTTEIAVLKSMLFKDSKRITKKISAEAEKRKLEAPNAEVACLIREAFSDKEIEAMGLCWIVAMHEPIKDSGGSPRLLYADRASGGGWLGACSDRPDRGWDCDGGFVFVVSQTQN